MAKLNELPEPGGDNLTPPLLSAHAAWLYRAVVPENRNEPLAAWMSDHQVSAAELAKAVNVAIANICGRPGETTKRSVFRWLSGATRWPQLRQRRGLEAVTGLPATALGFVPRGQPTCQASLEDPEMRRRQFFGAAVASTAAVAVPASPVSARPARVGTSDVLRLREDINRLVQLDAERGGHGLERAALAGAGEALALQQKAATQRVRHRLYALAARFTSAAAWSRIDAGALDGAERYLERALTFAGLAQDSEMAMQVWNLRSMLARQRHDYTEAVAASQAAKATTVARRSPLHASLAHARTAVGYANAGEKRAALSHLSRAGEALAKADLTQPRPTWLAFYGPAELYSLTAIVQDLVGRPAQAEAASHRALAALPPAYRRNRAHVTGWLALAQLHQGDIEQACATSSGIFTIMAGAPMHGRLRQLLGDFQRDLITLAPSAHTAHEWMDRYRTEWSKP